MAARPIAPVSRLLGRAGLLLACASLAACHKHVERNWSAGTPRYQGEISRLDGREEGVWTFWFPNGQMREQGRFERGLRVGRWRQWHANGVARCEGERTPAPDGSASLRTGYWRFWYESGELEGQGSFVAGEREGHWDYHLTDGRLDGDRSGEYHLDQRLL
jgi:hypothetical protein